MNEIQQKKIIEEYSVLRVILTVLVVVGHSIVIQSVTEYGGYDYTEFFSGEIISQKILSLLHSIIYSFHMPCFFALSGTLFYYAVANGRYNTLIELVREKALRLLLPYAVISLLWVFPWKMLSGYYLLSENILADFFVGQFLLQGNTHLWFLVTLFLIFIILYFFRFLKKSFLFVGLFVAYIVSGFCTINVIAFVLKYSFWFYLGYVFEPYRKQFNEKINLRLLASFIFLFLLSFFSERFFKVDSACVKYVIDFLVAVFGVIATYIFSIYVSKTSLIKKKWFIEINKYSFGIYLYSDTLNYPILCVMFLGLGNNFFASSGGYLFLFFIRVIVSMLVSIFLTKWLKKVGVKYIC